MADVCVSQFAVKGDFAKYDLSGKIRYITYIHTQREASILLYIQITNGVNVNITAECYGNVYSNGKHETRA